MALVERSLLGALVVLGCGGSHPQERSSNPTTSAASIAPAVMTAVRTGSATVAPGTRPASIGTLETRDHRLVIYATGSGPRLDLFAANGRQLAVNLEPAKLELYAPELAAAFQRGTAWADARVDRELLRSNAKRDAHETLQHDLR